MVLWTIVMQYTDRVVTAATILTTDSSYFKASVLHWCKPCYTAVNYLPCNILQFRNTISD